MELYLVFMIIGLLFLGYRQNSKPIKLMAAGFTLYSGLATTILELRIMLIIFAIAIFLLAVLDN